MSEFPHPMGYLAEIYKDRLPKASIGKSCISFKRLGDVDQAVLEQPLRNLARRARRAPARILWYLDRDGVR